MTGLSAAAPGKDERVSADVLKAAYERYGVALETADREELVTARLALCAALVGTGWSPPEAVQEQMRRDEKTLRRLRDVDTIDLTDGARLRHQRPLAVSPLA